MKIILPALLALFFPVTALAAPSNSTTKIQAPAKVDIAPDARAIFARSLELYRSLDALSMKWQNREEGASKGEDTTKVASFDFDRTGRLRLINCYLEEPLNVLDGKISWALNNPPLDGKGPTIYRRQTIEANDAQWLAMESLQNAGGLPEIMASFLTKSDPLDAERIQQRAEKFEFLELRTILLPAQPLDDQACDLVRITTVAHSPYIISRPITTAQETYWFARSDARLMRFQTRFIISGKQVSASDSRITAQTLNPTFAPNVFKFTPPPGAKLSEFDQDQSG